MKNAKTNTRARRLPTKLTAALIGAAALLCLAAPASALGAAALQLDVDHHLDAVPAGGYGIVEIKVSNPGDVATSTAPIVVEATVPAGLELYAVSDQVKEGPGAGVFGGWICSTPTPGTARCQGPTNLAGRQIHPGEEACLRGDFRRSCRILLFTRADEGLAPGALLGVTARACGGGVSTCPAEAATGTDQVPIGSQLPFGVSSFTGDALDELDVPVTQAAAHPHSAFTTFTLNTELGQRGFEVPTEQLQDAAAKLPPGLVGNPLAIDTCTQEQLRGTGGGPTCPPEAQIGTAEVFFGDHDLADTSTTTIPVYNMARPPGTAATPIGTPALFAFNIEGALIQVYAKLRSGEDYGATVISKNAPQTLPVVGFTFRVWGTPSAPAHDSERSCAGGGVGCVSADSADPRAFFTLPTSCSGPVQTTLEATSWQGSADEESFTTAPGGTGCPAVPFEPTLTARPTTNAGDSPSGLEVELAVPQSDAPNILATAHLKDTTVVLPEGLVINPAAANGLGACSEADFGYTATDPDGQVHTTPDPATCPAASKLATVEVQSPLLDHPIKGSAHIAEPYQNPFNSLLALYITLYDPLTGVVAKLAGEVSANPATGRLTASFQNNPQLPFETFRLHFFGGAGGSLRTPAICGTHTTTATLTPWSATGGASSSEETDPWSIDQGCAGSPAQLPNAPSFDAGALSPIAATHTPFVVRLSRADGSQNFAALTVRPPPGLVAKLAGTEPCPEAYLEAASRKPGASEAAVPSCPPGSQIGTVDVAAGAGPAPYHAPAKAYLSGPYKGAPLSMAVIAPAVAGPFDLGTVVTRIALHVDPKTAEITAISDPIPQILAGIPLDIRSVSVALDRPDFALTGTSCDPSAVNGLLTSTLGQIAQLSARYQLAECTGLGFKPKMSLRLKGGTKRGRHPALTATIFPRPGDANIKSVSVAFPRSEFLENAHIRTICTRPDFAADRCPAGAVYGSATVDTPLLDYDLSGNVYLRSSDNLLPDVVTDLRGPAHQPLRVEAAGRTDSIRGGIRNTFDFFPDAPFAKATVALQGGNKGLLVNSRNICARVYRATVRFTAHNNMTRTIRPKLVATACKKKRRKAKRRGHKRSSKRSALAARSSVR